MKPREVFVKHLREMRKNRGWSQEQLALRLRHLGVDLDRTKIAKIETDHRDVSLDEVFGIAAALDAAPVFLLFPWGEADTIEVTPKIEASAADALDWFKGESTLEGQDPRYYEIQRPAFPDTIDRVLARIEPRLDEISRQQARNNRKLTAFLRREAVALARHAKEHPDESFDDLVAETTIATEQGSDEPGEET